METKVYNNTIVQEHSLYIHCGSTLNTISNRDYPNKNYFNPHIECLDMDTYEKEILHKSQPDHSVDAVIGISSYLNNRETDTRLLLVELRIDYNNTSNLSKTAMERKVTYTKSLLGGEKPINTASLFIFNEKFAPQAQWWFNQQQRCGGVLSQSITCSVSDFANQIKSTSDFPYTPIHNGEEITKKLFEFEDSRNWETYQKQISFWCKKANEYEYKNPQESNHIKMIIKMAWYKFRSKIHPLSDDDELKFEILEEDYPFLIEL